MGEMFPHTHKKTSRIARRILSFGCVIFTTIGAPFSVAQEANAKPVDVVLITIDTLRADALGFAGNKRVKTPHLDRLATGGRIFTDAHAHNVVTLPSHANILTGLYPYQHGVRDNSGFQLPPTIPTAATLLQGAGYSTAAFVAAYPLDSSFGLNRGFDLYDDQLPKGSNPTEFILPERRGDEVVSAALEWWNRAPGPRFLWLHLFDPHAPYDPPEPYSSRFKDAPYLGEVAATDGYLGALLEPLLERGPTSTLVIVTADHGESLGEHGELTHGLFAYEATLHIPLVLWGPGVNVGKDSRPARHIDILPTILATAGIEPPPAPAGQKMLGQSLLKPWEESEKTYFEALSANLNRGWAPLHGLLEEGNKLIVLPLPELYDVQQDPAEKNNLYDVRRPIARTLRDGLPPEALEPATRTFAPAPEASERLRSLGYLAGSAPKRKSYGVEDDPKNLIELDRKMHRAIDLYSQRRLPEAVRLSREIVEQRPQMALGQSLLAQALLESGLRQEALAAMDKARELGAVTDTLLRQLGLTLAAEGRGAEAVELLTPLATGGDLETLLALALAQSESGNQNGARKTLEEVFKEDPDHPVAHERSCLIDLRLERWSEARKACGRALELNDRLPYSWNSLGVALFQLGETEAALDAWQKAVDLDSRLFDALYNLGTQALSLGRTEQAEGALRRFVENAPAAVYGNDLRRARVLLRRLERQSSSP